VSVAFGSGHAVTLPKDTINAKATIPDSSRAVGVGPGPLGVGYQVTHDLRVVRTEMEVRLVLAHPVEVNSVVCTGEKFNCGG
jgi:hypothetical protein